MFPIKNDTMRGIIGVKKLTEGTIDALLDGIKNKISSVKTIKQKELDRVVYTFENSANLSKSFKAGSILVALKNNNASEFREVNMHVLDKKPEKGYPYYAIWHSTSKEDIISIFIPAQNEKKERFIHIQRENRSAFKKVMMEEHILPTLVSDQNCENFFGLSVVKNVSGDDHSTSVSSPHSRAEAVPEEGAYAQDVSADDHTYMNVSLDVYSVVHKNFIECKQKEKCDDTYSHLHGVKTIITSQINSSQKKIDMTGDELTRKLEARLAKLQAAESEQHKENKHIVKSSVATELPSLSG